MANKTAYTSESSGSSSSARYRITFTAINANIDALVPSNAVLDALKVGFWVQKTGGLGDGDLECYLANTSNAGTVITQLVSKQSDFVNSNGNTMWADLTPYLVNGHVTHSNINVLVFYLSATFSKDYKYKGGYSVDYHIPQYTLTVNASPTAGGTVTGGGTYDNAATATLTATAKTGYKFVRWSDGNTSASRTVTVTANATYTAIFEEKVYVTYNNMFSVEKWINRGISNATIDSTYNTIEVTNAKTDGEIYTSTSHKMPVTAGRTYNARVTVRSATAANAEMFVFFYANETTDSWASLSNKSVNIAANGQSSINFDFTVPSGATHIAIRVDNNTPGTTIEFAGIVIRPIECLGNASIDADIGAWGDGLYTPSLEGYVFLGWFDDTEGGTQYTDSSPFPTTDTVLYPRFRIRNIYVGTSQVKEIYVGTTPVKAVYVGTTKIWEA